MVKTSEVVSVPRNELEPSASRGITIPTKPCLIHVGGIGTYASNMSARLCYGAQTLGCMRMFGSWLISDSETVSVEMNSKALRSLRSGVIDRVQDVIKPVKRGKNFFIPTWGHPGYGKDVRQAIEDARYWKRDIVQIIDLLKKHFEMLGLKTRIAITEEGFGATSLSQGTYFRALARRFLRELDLYICIGIIGKDLPTQRNFKKYLPLILQRGFNNNAMVLYANWRRPLQLTNKDIDYQIAYGMLATASSSLWYRGKLSIGDIWHNLIENSPIIGVSMDRRHLPTYRKRFRTRKDNKATVGVLTSMLRSVWHDPSNSLLRVPKTPEELEAEKVFEVASVVGDVTEEELNEAEELAEIPRTASTVLLSGRHLKQIYVTRFTPLVMTTPEIDWIYEVKREPEQFEEISDLVPVGKKDFDQLVYEGFQDYQRLEKTAEFPSGELIGEGWRA